MMMNSSSLINRSSSSWEEKAFAQDINVHARDGSLGSCVWPPRSYSCTFCMREFRSAQALGGHMNIHRRDRARLKQCLSNDVISPPSTGISDHQDHQYHSLKPLVISTSDNNINLDPNSCPSSSKTQSRFPSPVCNIDSRVSTISSSSENPNNYYLSPTYFSSSPHINPSSDNDHLSFGVVLSTGLEKKTQDHSTQGVLDGSNLDGCVETDLCVGLSNNSFLIRPPSTAFCEEIDVDHEASDCNRPKLLFFLKPCHILQSKVNIHEVKNIASNMDDLDLELRLGHDPPKVKELS